MEEGGASVSALYIHALSKNINYFSAYKEGFNYL